MDFVLSLAKEPKATSFEPAKEAKRLGWLRHAV